MKSIFFITGTAFFIWAACTSKQSPDRSAAGDNDLAKKDSAFNRKQELFIVTYIAGDTVDPLGNPCRWVEMRSSKDSLFTSCFTTTDPVKTGDSIWIGYNDAGVPYIIRYANLEAEENN